MKPIVRYFSVNNVQRAVVPCREGLVLSFAYRVSVPPGTHNPPKITLVSATSGRPLFDPSLQQPARWERPAAIEADFVNDDWVIEGVGSVPINPGFGDPGVWEVYLDIDDVRINTGAVVEVQT